MKPRRKNRPRRHERTKAQVTRVAPPKGRLRHVFTILGDVIRTAEALLLAVPLPEDDDDRRHTVFEIGVANRANSALKATRLLCEQGHWEFAAAVVRQLFELLLSIEHIGRLPDRRAAVFRYAKFGLLETIQARLAEAAYDEKTGRPVDSEYVAMLHALRDRGFSDFKVGPGGKKWSRTWSGLSARDLADRSESTIRRDQYEILFRVWSQQTHATPGAMLAEVLPTDVDIDAIVRDDDVRIVETCSVAIGMFIDLWSELPHLPKLDPAKSANWLGALLQEAHTYQPGATG